MQNLLLKSILILLQCNYNRLHLTESLMDFWNFWNYFLKKLQNCSPKEMFTSTRHISGIVYTGSALYHNQKVYDIVIPYSQGRHSLYGYI